MPSVAIDLDIDLCEFDDSDLINELRNRLYFVSDDPIDDLAIEDIVFKLYIARCLNENLDEHLNGIFDLVLNKRI